MVTEYPHQFSSEARNRIESEKLRASKELEQRRNQVPWTKFGPSRADEANLYKYILRVFSVFAKEACNLCSRRLWTLDQVRGEAEKYLRLLVIEAYFERGYDKKGRKLREVTSHWDGSILPDVRQQLRESDEWLQYEDELLAAAEAARTEEPEVAQPAQPAIRSQELDSRTVFKPSDDYVLIEYRGSKYNLTPLAGEIVKVLHQAHEEGRVGVGRADIKRKTKCGRVWDAFRRRDGRRFWSRLIKKIEKDMYALDLNHSPMS